MNETKYIEYAKLKEKERQIKERLKEMEAGLISQMLEAEQPQYEIPQGLFSIRTNKTWKYSEHVTGLAEQLKIAKKTEEENGVATAEEKSSLVFKAG